MMPLDFYLKYTGNCLKFVNIQNMLFISVHLKNARFTISSKTLIDHEISHFFVFLCLYDNKYFDSGRKMCMIKSI